MAETKKAKGMCTTFLLKKKKKKKSLAKTVIKTEFRQRQQSCRSTSTTVHKKKVYRHSQMGECLPACLCAFVCGCLIYNDFSGERERES